MNRFPPESPVDSGFEQLNPQSTREILTVGDLNRAVSGLLRSSFSLLWVAGEISNFSRAASGHWYFTLKDSVASVRAVMFRGAVRRVDFAPKEGDRVEVLARVSLYEARGDFQLAVEQMRESGAGDLYQRFLRIKAALQAEGLFEAARKRTLRPARRVGVISSPHAAALRDVLTTLRRRAPFIDVIIYPASVQGAQAPAELIAALERANRRAECDVLLLVRGGGAIEDLDAFNDEGLARCIAASALPIVSGVGHETDFTISDFVADARAPTPTAAAVLVSADRAEIQERLSRLQVRMSRAVLECARRAGQRLDGAERLLRSPSQQLIERFARLDRSVAQLSQAMRQVLGVELARWQLGMKALRAPRVDLPQAHLANLSRSLFRAQQATLEAAAGRLARGEAALALVSPRSVLDRGYAIVRDETGGVVRDPRQVGIGVRIDIELAAGRLGARVERGA